MKIKAEVLEAKANGEVVTLKLQGRTPGAAPWRSYLSINIDLPEHKKTARTFYLGRIVEIEVRAK